MGKKQSCKPIYTEFPWRLSSVIDLVQKSVYGERTHQGHIDLHNHSCIQSHDKGATVLLCSSSSSQVYTQCFNNSDFPFYVLCWREILPIKQLTIFIKNHEFSCHLYFYLHLCPKTQISKRTG